jgi:hypothetical protein
MQQTKIRESCLDGWLFGERIGLEQARGKRMFCPISRPGGVSRRGRAAIGADKRVHPGRLLAAGFLARIFDWKNGTMANNEVAQ